MQETHFCHCWIKDSLTNHWSSFCSNAESVSLWYFQPAVSNCVYYLCYVEHEFWRKLKQDSPKTALLVGFADTNSPGSGGTLSKHKHCSFFIFRMITWWETPPHRFPKMANCYLRPSVCLLKSAGRAAHSSVSTSRARPEVNTALGAVHTTPSFLFIPAIKWLKSHKNIFQCCRERLLH